ncbi:MAG: nitroreductase family protein [Chloroflexota bacterium]|nr:nitroreductase family protein [Chloroflexota bacterium]
MPFPALARGRRSVRSYTDAPVARAVVEQVLEAGRWAPSPHGRQPWRFVVLTRPAAKRALAEAMGDEWRRNLAMDGQSADVVDIRLHKSYQRLLAAPVLIIPCLYEADLDRYPDPDRQAAEHLMAVQSVGAAAQTMLLAAYSLGLDGGWMCAPLFCPDAVRAALGLDARYAPQAVLTLGYAAGPPKRRTRLPLADLIARYD